MKGRIIRPGQTYNPEKLHFPLVGKIKVGEKVERNGKTFPASLDYFRPTGIYAPLFRETYGEKPEKLTIIFINDDPQYSCNEELIARDPKNGKLIAKSYGTGDTHIVDPKTGDFYQEPDPAKVQAIAPANTWRVTLTLRFILPKLRGLIGCWVLETHGKKSSIQNLRDVFDTILYTAGTVKNIPFELSVKKVKSQKAGENRLFPVIDLVPNISADNIETVRTYITAGNQAFNTLGMLTDEKINSLKTKEIGYDEA